MLDQHIKLESRVGIWAFGGLLVGLVGMGLGCGRDGTQRGGPSSPQTCQDDGDCLEGATCVDGQCVSEGVPDAGPPDTTGVCQTNGDCPEDQVCNEDTNQCVDLESPDTDAGDGGRCEPCPPWTEPAADNSEGAANRCECTETSCSSSSDCGDFACVDETCQPCESERQCADGERCDTSGTFNRCVPDTCQADDDCEAREECGDDQRCINRDECLVDDDCEDPETCFNGRCTFSPDCQDDSDCRSGLECIGGRCYEEICRGNADCQGDQICNGGECIEPDSTDVDRCFVSTSDQTIAENERVRLEAFAVDAQGNGVPAQFQWSSSNPSVARIGSSGDVAIGGASTGRARLTAQTQGSDAVQCQGDVELRRLQNVSSNQLRIVVRDARTRSPVSNADVVVQTSGSQRAQARTNANGVATLPNPGGGSGTYTVSVFASDYNYLTVRGVNSRDIRLPLVARSGTGPVAGFKGTFDTRRLHSSGDVTLGLAGSSITGGLLELSLDQLLGAPFRRRVQTPVGNRTIALSSGLVAYGQVAGVDLDVKQKYYATAPGGTQLSWGLAGEVPGLRLFQIIQQGGNTLANLLPLFNRFDHAVRPLPNLQEIPRVTDSGDIDGDGDTSETLPDYKGFRSVSMQPSVRQNLVTEVSISNFPTLRTGDTDFAVLVGGNLLPSTGFVPLGISATTDEDDDGFPDARRLSMAPPHGPLTGGRFAILAIAFQGDNFSPGGGFSLPDDLSIALWSRQTLDRKVGLGTFPDATQGQIDTNQRTLSLDADAGPLYRARFVGSTRSWEVWSMGPKGSMGQYQHTMEIPSISNRKDLFANADKILVDSIQASVTIDDLIKSTGIGLRSLGTIATAFNRTKLQ